MVCIACIHIARSPVRNDAVNRLDQALVPTRTLLELRNTTCESYYILLVCPSCWRSAWISLRKRAASRESLLNTVWEFQCRPVGRKTAAGRREVRVALGP